MGEHQIADAAGVRDRSGLENGARQLLLTGVEIAVHHVAAAMIVPEADLRPIPVRYTPKIGAVGASRVAW